MTGPVVEGFDETEMEEVEGAWFNGVWEVAVAVATGIGALLLRLLFKQFLTFCHNQFISSSVGVRSRRIPLSPAVVLSVITPGPVGFLVVAGSEMVWFWWAGFEVLCSGVTIVVLSGVVVDLVNFIVCIG